MQNFNRLKLRFNRLFIVATKAELKQTVIRSERERFTQQTLYWFTQPLATSSSQNNLWVPLIITHRLQHTQPQRGDLETTRTTHPLCKHTPLARTTSDFTGFHTHLQVYERSNTGIMKGT